MANKVYEDGNAIFSEVGNNIICIAVDRTTTLNIVSMFNAHDDLVAALEEIASLPFGLLAARIARAALVKMDEI